MMCLQRQNRVLEILKLAVVNCLMWVLGTELQSSVRAASVFNL